MKLKYLIIVLILSLPAIGALLHSGFFGASDDLHIAWLQQMYLAISDGKIPPRFVPNLSFNYGYPLFNFVFPLPFYIGSLLHFIGLSFVDSVKGVFLLSLLFSAIAMYALARQLTSSRIMQILSSLLYVYTPYRATDTYVRGALGESLAFVFYPLIVLSILRLSQKRYLALGAFSLACLILSHNISAYMFIPFVLVFAIITNYKQIKSLLTLFTAGLLASIYFWLPALLDSRQMKYDTVFNFIDHFPTIKQLFTPYWGYGASVPGPYDGMSFFIGITNIAVIIFSAVFFLVGFRRRDFRTNQIIIWAGAMLALSLFMTNFRSTVLWSSLPLLPYFQFPWRFLSLITFATAFLLSLFTVSRSVSRLLIFVVIFLLLSNQNIFRPQDFLARQDSYYLNRYIPFPSASDEYLTLKEEYLRLPNSTLIRPSAVPPTIVSDALLKDLRFANNYDVSFSADSEFSANVEYNKYLFAGWSASIDGKPAILSTGSPYGQISLQLPPGSHQVSITYHETLFNLLLDLISLFTFIVISIFIFLPNRNTKNIYAPS